MPKKQKQQRLQRKKRPEPASLAPISKAIKQFAADKQAEAAKPLDEDQKQWLEEFGSLDGYLTPAQRQAAIEEDAKRHGQPLPVKAPPATRAVVGVYQNHHSFPALVVRVGVETVHFITNRKWEKGTCTSGPIVLEHETHKEFVREFKFYLPHYPLRRAARILLESFIHKSEEALRELRAVLAR